MAYDASPPAEVTARDRVIMLRDHLARLKPEHFDMASWGFEHDCGTAACIAGWNGLLTNDPPPTIEWVKPTSGGYDDIALEAWISRQGASLGLNEDDAAKLFVPDTEEGLGELTARRAVAVLDNYLSTGLIDWSVTALEPQIPEVSR